MFGRCGFFLLSALGCFQAEAAGRLAGTAGMTDAEGAAGGGITTWALIGGYDTREQVAGNSFFTTTSTQTYHLDVTGASVGLYDRVELSYARQHFGLGDVAPGQAINQDIFGAKVRVFGDAIADQDRALPQVALGVMYKRNLDYAGIPQAVGAQHASDYEPYVAATKVWIDGVSGRSVLLDATLRYTRANQFGILGFGGDHSDSRCLCWETSGAAFLSDHVVSGIEWRRKPNLLNAFQERAAYDGFVAWIPSRHLSFAAAYVDYGDIAGRTHQQGPYISLKLDLN
jgi:hypothetical protein